MAGSDFSLGPSASQAGTPVMPSLTAAALAALQTQTRTASEVSKGKAKSSQSDAQERGSLVHTLKYEGNGFWIATTSGNVWCGAKGYIPLDLYSACNAALLPEGVPRLPYCTLSRGCRHILPKNFEAVHSSKVIPAKDLLKVDAGGDKAKEKAKGKGEKGKKGKGKGKGKGQERKRKAEAEVDDVGDE